MLVNLKKAVKDHKLWLLIPLALGIVLLFPVKRNEGAQKAEIESSFSLEDEERRIAAALEKIEGAGSVTVVLTLERSEQHEFARNTDSDRQTQAESGRTEERSEIAEVGDGALTVTVLYPRYRGALVVMEGDGSALRLSVTQAVSSLTGLGSDKITVIGGSR